MYLYDLPKKNVTSKGIAEAFRQKCGAVIEQRPQIRRDFFRPFYSAIVVINDPVQYKKACDEMRYFELEKDGQKFQCRALPFDPQLLGSNKEKLTNNNIFYKAPSKDPITYDFLTQNFSKYGPIKSLKISLNMDHSQRGFAYVCFENQEDAQKAANGDANAFIFEQKENRNTVGKLINNLYFKNIPEDMTNEAVTALFAPFGTIKSLVVEKGQIGKYGFVCYMDPTGKDNTYGPTCVNKAIEALMNREMTPGPDGLKLYVRHALNKSQREQEKLLETIRYKSSKKRVNLYVKNFPASWGEEEIRTEFGKYGELENVRIEAKKNEPGNQYAFVCYKQPDSCANAKQQLSNHQIEGKVLIINNYEIKEIREIQMEELRDKSDFEQYRQQQTGGFQWNDLTSQPHLTQIISQLLSLMQQNGGQQDQRGGMRGPQQNRRYQNNGGQGGQQRMHHNNMGGQGMP
jgi:RNA recognition motif-containing protein